MGGGLFRGHSAHIADIFGGIAFGLFLAGGAGIGQSLLHAV